MFTDKQIAAFVVKNYPRAKEWEFEALRRWIAWNIKEGFCLLVGEDYKLMGMALMRPTMTPEKCPNNQDFDQEGDTLFVDLVVTLKPKRELLQCLGFALLERFGQRSKLAFQRHGIGPVHVVDAKEHRRKLLREKHYVK